MLAKAIIMSLFFFAASADLLVRDAAAAELAFAVDREHHQADLDLAVVGHRLGDRRPAVGAEVLVGGAVVLLAIVVERVPARHLGVRVDVDGDQVLNIHGACSFRLYAYIM
jgi:hypothetical protein